MARSWLLPFALALILLSLSFHPFCAHTVVVDGVAKLEVPALHVGDSVVFKQVQHYELYMFHEKRAFELCNFSQASLLRGAGGNSTSYFTWHPSGPGKYYFSYQDRSLTDCEAGKHVQVTVVPSSAFSPASSPHPAPPPTSGGDAGAFFPSLPHARRSTSPRPSPAGALLPLPGRSPSVAPPPFSGPGSGIPFISSNPALPLPSGEADAAASRPLPVTGGSGHQVAGTCLGIRMSALLSLVVALGLCGGGI